jgi:excisionase family DNA binding protein
MSDMTTTTPPPADDAVIAGLRAKLIGNKVTIAQAAAAFGVTERTVYLAIDRHRIPFVKVFDVRYLEPDDLRRALVHDQNSAPRGRGRPRNAAA